LDADTVPTYDDISRPRGGSDKPEKSDEFGRIFAGMA
jgi:hypothetical protein